MLCMLTGNECVESVASSRYKRHYSFVYYSADTGSDVVDPIHASEGNCTDGLFVNVQVSVQSLETS